MVGREQMKWIQLLSHTSFATLMRVLLNCSYEGTRPCPTGLSWGKEALSPLNCVRG